jgi:chorismate mutase
VRQTGLSRSAFYKYKDCVFPAEDLRRLLTLQAVLVNERGTLQSLLAGLSEAGADVVTIHQQKPKGDLAQVVLTVDTSAVEMDVLVLLDQLRTRSFVRSIELLDE